MRALTKPYVGAHIAIEKNKYVVWKVEEEEKEFLAINIEPGKVLSIVENKIQVKTGDGSVWLVKHELKVLPKLERIYEKVIVISAHPDDEVLGCGGTLIKHRESGDKIDWLITTNIDIDLGYSSRRVKSRQDEIIEIENKLKINKTYKLNYPTMSLSDETLIEMIPISEIFKESKPEIIYVLNRSDAHSDHLITFKAVMACTKSFRYPFIKASFNV